MVNYNVLNIKKYIKHITLGSFKSGCFVWNHNLNLISNKQTNDSNLYYNHRLCSVESHWNDFQCVSRVSPRVPFTMQIYLSYPSSTGIYPGLSVIWKFILCIA